jgi:hypothetical protein
MVWLSKVSLLPTSPTRADSDPSSSPTRLSTRESAAGAASHRASHDDPTGSAYTRRDECGSRPAHRDVPARRQKEVASALAPASVEVGDCVRWRCDRPVFGSAGHPLVAIAIAGLRTVSYAKAIASLTVLCAAQNRRAS